MDTSEYENIARVENRHWWYRGMAAISMSLLNRYIGTNSKFNFRILDAGCGTGGMLHHLWAIGRPIGIDFHPLAVHYAQRRAPVARASISHLPFNSSSFSLVTSFDVIYHRAVVDDIQAFNELYRVLEAGGYLLVRLPALRSMAGHHDEVVHTARRYEAADLRKKLERAGFDIIRLSYANTILLPAIYLQRKFFRNSKSDVQLPHPVINGLLEWVLEIERILMGLLSLPIGVSIFALAIKPETELLRAAT